MLIGHACVSTKGPASGRLLAEPRRETGIKNHPRQAIGTYKDNLILLDLFDIAGMPDKKHPVAGLRVFQSIEIIGQVSFSGSRFDLYEGALTCRRQHKLDVHGFLDLSNLPETTPATIEKTRSTSSSKSCHVSRRIREMNLQQSP
jgi:hypothetical protein